MANAVVRMDYIPWERSRAVVITCVTLIIFAFISVALRLWTRIFMTCNMGKDDVFAVIALVSRQLGFIIFAFPTSSNSIGVLHRLCSLSHR
jgi:hypothetical protein